MFNGNIHDTRAIWNELESLAIRLDMKPGYENAAVAVREARQTVLDNIARDLPDSDPS